MQFEPTPWLIVRGTLTRPGRMRWAARDSSARHEEFALPQLTRVIADATQRLQIVPGTLPVYWDAPWPTGEPPTGGPRARIVLLRARRWRARAAPELPLRVAAVERETTVPAPAEL